MPLQMKQCCVDPFRIPAEFKADREVNAPLLPRQLATSATGPRPHAHGRRPPTDAIKVCVVGVIITYRMRNFQETYLYYASINVIYVFTH